jgi:hypothetical protein
MNGVRSCVSQYTKLDNIITFITLGVVFCEILRPSLWSLQKILLLNINQQICLYGKCIPPDQFHSESKLTELSGAMYIRRTAIHRILQHRTMIHRTSKCQIWWYVKCCL